MNDKIKFVVEGTPVPKQSFRVVTRTKEGKTKVAGYRNPKITQWQNEVALMARLAVNRTGLKPDNLLQYAGVLLEFRIPDRRVVDLDNLSKAVLDALKHITWKDDSAVIDLHIIKSVCKNNPGVTVTVWPVDGGSYKK